MNWHVPDRDVLSPRRRPAAGFPGRPSGFRGPCRLLSDSARRRRLGAGGSVRKRIHRRAACWFRPNHGGPRTFRAASSGAFEPTGGSEPAHQRMQPPVHVLLLGLWHRAPKRRMSWPIRIRPAHQLLPEAHARQIPSPAALRPTRASTNLVEPPEPLLTPLGFPRKDP